MVASTGNKIGHKCRTIPYNLTNQDLQILTRCFKHDGKIRSPTKAKLWYLISGSKKELSYSEIRYILKYIDDEYKYNVESKMKYGFWDSDLATHFNMKKSRYLKLTPARFSKCLSVYKERRNPGQKKTRDLIEKILQDKDNELLLPLNDDNVKEIVTEEKEVKVNEPVEVVVVKEEKEHKDTNDIIQSLDDFDDLTPICTIINDSPKSIMDKKVISSQCVII